MTTKELAMMFAGCIIPSPEMEKIINDHVKHEIIKFANAMNNLYPFTQEDIDIYLKQLK